MKRLLPLVLFAGFWLLLVLGGRTNFFRDPGTFWHTVVGEKLLAEGFLRHDPFTFTFAGEPWIPYQWLGEVVMALAHRVNGFDAQLAGATGLLAGLFTALTLRLTRTGLNPVAAVLFMGLVLAASSTHFHVRPHIATMLGLAVTLIVVTEVEAGRRSWRSVGWLVPLYVVWTNVHGGVLGGLTTLGLAGAGWTLFALLGRPTPVPTWRAVLGLLAVGVLCGLTAFVNPYGVDLPRTWMLIMTFPHLSQLIVEHAPPDFANPFTWPLLALGFVYLSLLAGTKPRDWRVSWFLPLFWMLQTYGRVRHAPLFAIAACVAVADLWPATIYARRLATRRPDFYAPTPVVASTLRATLRALVLPALVVLFVFAVQASRSPWAAWADFDRRAWPLEMVEVMREHEPRPGQPNRLFNDYVDGAFTIYHAPGYKVFVDDRCELFGDAWLVEFVETGNGERAVVRQMMARWQEQYGRFDFALTRLDTPFDTYYAEHPEAWERLRAGETANFYRRRP